MTVRGALGCREHELTSPAGRFVSPPDERPAPFHALTLGMGMLDARAMVSIIARRSIGFET